MNTTTTSSVASLPAQRAPSRRVVDAPIRALHWLLALSFAGAYLTADGERWRLIHVTLGYTVAGLLVARVLWGLFGTPTARLVNLGRRLKGLPDWLRAAVRGDIDARKGPNLAQAAAIVLLLGVIAPLTLSGLAVYQEWASGEWLAGLHELAGNAMLTLVLVHLGMMLVLSWQRRRNVMAVMVTGRAPGAGADLVKRPFGGVAALLLAAVLGFWGWQWLNAPTPNQGASTLAAVASHQVDRD